MSGRRPVGARATSGAPDRSHAQDSFEYDLRQPIGRTRVATAAMTGSLKSFSTISILSVAATAKPGPPVGPKTMGSEYVVEVFSLAPAD